jgi:hypothetical protein
MGLVLHSSWRHARRTAVDDALMFRHPPSQTFELYRNTERKTVVRKAQASLRRKLPTMAVVHDVDLSAGKLVYTVNGDERRDEFATIPRRRRDAFW